MRVTFFGNFGTPSTGNESDLPNTGNESNLLSAFEYLHARYPDCEFLCVTEHPAMVTAPEHIKGIAVHTRKRWLWNSTGGPIKRLALTFAAVGEEIGQYVRAFQTLRGSRLFIVPGTGLLTDGYGNSAGGISPYSLFKWSAMARAAGCRIVFLSVGAGPINTRAGRLLVKASLRLANYRSFRDEASLRCIVDSGFRSNGDRVRPDLAFGLPPTVIPASQRTGGNVVGLGLMEHSVNYGTNPEPESHSNYLTSLATFAHWLLEQDYTIRLILGDKDTHVIDEFLAVLGAHDKTRVIYEPTGTVPKVMAELAACDLVVATRFHNTVLALLLDNPTISISFHNKCTALMEGMELSDYCIDIRELDSATLIEKFQKLQRN